MRLVSVVVSSLLFAASTALAAQPPPEQSSATPRGEQAHPGPVTDDARRRSHQDGAGSQDLGEPPGLTRTMDPTFRSGAAARDQDTEANCYIVFAELRCDRIPSRSAK